MKPPGREPSRPLAVQPGLAGAPRPPTGEAQRANVPMRRPGNLDQVPTTILLEHVTGRSRQARREVSAPLRAAPQEDVVRRSAGGPERFERPLAAPLTEQQPSPLGPRESGHHQLTTVRANPYQTAQGQGAQPEAAATPAMPVEAPTTAARVGQVVAFFATHGGTGATTLACNGAAALARRQQATCLVDLDLQLGDALTVLGLEPKCAMSRLAHEMESFDWEMLEPMLPRHGSGLSVVSQVGNLEELGELTVGRMPQVLRYLQGHFACVVVDGVRDFGDHALATLDVADRVVLVVTQGVSAVRGASRRLAIFRRLGYPASKIQIVVNRYSPRHPISLAAFTEALGQAPVAVIPEDAATAGRAAMKGALLHEVDAGGAVDGAIEGMIHGLFGLAAPTRPVARRWWSRRPR
ncbi:MAG: AAA family ATPase [Proteobacteria bacterium]|nr:AAA family ATPase [Pseudomonadota bacterium]